MARISLLFRSKQSYDSCIWQVRGRRIQRWHSRALRCKLRGPNPRLRPSLPSVCPLFEIGLHAWCRFKINKIMEAGNHTIQSLTSFPPPFSSFLGLCSILQETLAFSLPTGKRMMWLGGLKNTERQTLHVLATKRQRL